MKSVDIDCYKDFDGNVPTKLTFSYDVEMDREHGEATVFIVGVVDENGNDMSGVIMTENFEQTRLDLESEITSDFICAANFKW